MDNFIYSLFSCGIGYMCIYIYTIYIASGNQTMTTNGKSQLLWMFPFNTHFSHSVIPVTQLVAPIQLELVFSPK